MQYGLSYFRPICLPLPACREEDDDGGRCSRSLLRGGTARRFKPMDVSVMQKVRARLQEDRHLEDTTDFDFELEALLLQRKRRRQGAQYRCVPRAGPRLEDCRWEQTASSCSVRPH